MMGSGNKRGETALPFASFSPKSPGFQSQGNHHVQQSVPLQSKSQAERIFELEQPAAHPEFWNPESNLEFILRQVSFV